MIRAMRKLKVAADASLSLPLGMGLFCINSINRCIEDGGEERAICSFSMFSHQVSFGVISASRESNASRCWLRATRCDTHRRIISNDITARDARARAIARA